MRMFVIRWASRDECVCVLVCRIGRALVGGWISVCVYIIITGI